MKQVIDPIALAAIMICASIVAGCTTLAPANVSGLRRVVGIDLIGARGATSTDQRKIDRTVVGICAAGVWTRDECARHNQAPGRPK
jgi:Ni2+-binding GTPase involved in maturation of urease and hydrogenase